MLTVRVPRKPVVLVAVNSHEMPAVVAGLDQSSPRPSLAGHLLTRMGGAGERFGPDYIWVSWVGGKDLAPGALTSGPWPVDADALHRYLLDHSPCARPVKNETGRRHSSVLRGTVRSGAAPRGARPGFLFGEGPQHPGQAADRDAAGGALACLLGRDQPGQQRGHRRALIGEEPHITLRASQHQRLGQLVHRGVLVACGR